ncbi:site-specific DNA-methyltransferase [Streptomyces antimycoticus]|uniref:DNA-methyltransferase n=1 Tax=Streptomyces antimycoticus TaxID=68175 RepID=UPI003442B8CC
MAEPYYQDEQVTLLLGDAREVLCTLPDTSVDCIVTSPPYYGLRDYGTPGQYGLEPTPAAYVETMRSVFAEARRVLADDGTLWLNLGDSYYSAKGRPHGADAKQIARRGFLRPLDGPGLGFPRKSLLMVPARVAIALQDDGWTLRSEITWRRTTAVPEPTAKDRPWRTTERLFMFVKQPRYWFNRAPLAGAEDMWTIEPDRSAESNGHAAPFPIGLPSRCIQAGCRPGGTVLDPFSGSGTTGAAARHLDRRYIGIDLNATYHDLAKTRFAQTSLFFDAEPA